MVTHFSILVWEIPWTEEPGRPQCTGLKKESDKTTKWLNNNIYMYTYVSVYISVHFSRSVVSNSLWPHESQHARPPCPSPTPRVYSNIESVMPSSHFILCRPLLLLPPIPPSIRVFSNESTLCMRWPKYWSFSFSISPSSEHPGLISFRMDWLDLLQSKGLSRVFSNIIVQKYQFFSTQRSSQSNYHIHTWTLEKPEPWLGRLLLAK